MMFLSEIIDKFFLIVSSLSCNLKASEIRKFIRRKMPKLNKIRIASSI